MVLLRDFSLPAAAQELNLAPEKPFFIAFLASRDPATNEPWCPDVRAAIPVLNAALDRAEGPAAAYVEVGQREEWRKPDNVFRTKWNVNSVPTLVCYEKKGDAVREVGRLVEGEILDRERLGQLLKI